MITRGGIRKGKFYSNDHGGQQKQKRVRGTQEIYTEWSRQRTDTLRET